MMAAPAQAEVQIKAVWIPACAGMTGSKIQVMNNPAATDGVSNGKF
jgi:hypothetical protein